VSAATCNRRRQSIIKVNHWRICLDFFQPRLTKHITPQCRVHQGTRRYLQGRRGGYHFSGCHKAVTVVRLVSSALRILVVLFLLPPFSTRQRRSEGRLPKAVFSDNGSDGAYLDLGLLRRCMNCGGKDDGAKASRGQGRGRQVARVSSNFWSVTALP